MSKGFIFLFNNMLSKDFLIFLIISLVNECDIIKNELYYATFNSMAGQKV